MTTEEKIEMHCHTLFSVDGSGTPEQMVDKAADRGITALSITDHNSTGGCKRAGARAAQKGIQYLSGVEIDAFYGPQSYHFVAFGFDPDNQALKDLMTRQQENYVVRFEILLAQMQALGCEIKENEIKSKLPEFYPSHPHPVLNPWALRHFIRDRDDSERLTNIMEKARKQIANSDERPLHERLNTRGKFCSFREARDTIHEAGGVILLAHVGKALKDRPDLQIQLIEELSDKGLDGFEVYHPFHHDNFDNDNDKPQISGLKKLAAEMGCLVSGGTDCHHVPGTGRREIGSSGLEKEMFEKIETALKERQESGKFSGSPQ